MTHPAHHHLCSRSKDGNVLNVSFNSSPPLFETATECSLSNRYCTFRPLELSAKRWQAFFEKLILVLINVDFTIDRLVRTSSLQTPSMLYTLLSSSTIQLTSKSLVDLYLTLSQVSGPKVSNWFVLFDLILYVPVNTFTVMLRWVFLG